LAMSWVGALIEKKIFFGNIDRNDFIPESCMKTK
jgi:hypothetical protein